MFQGAHLVRVILLEHFYILSYMELFQHLMLIIDQNGPMDLEFMMLVREEGDLMLVSLSSSLETKVRKMVIVFIK